jgi:hypothetical protein
VAPECFEQEQETGLDLLGIAQMDEAASNAMLATLLAITDYLARLEQHIMTAKKYPAILFPFQADIRVKSKTPEGFSSSWPCTDASWRINLASTGFE